MRTNKQNPDIALFQKHTQRFAEAVLLPIANAQSGLNEFGREVQVFSKGGLSKLLGMALAGMRSSAFINDNILRDNLQAAAAFSRLHVPLTIVVQQQGLSCLPTLIDAGFIVFNASDNQQFTDLLSIAQVVSEKSLCPVALIISELDHSNKLEEIPSLTHWFGDPDGRVDYPTSAQELVFGPNRRRMPIWSHIDQPILTAPKKELNLQALERAARQVYDHSHIQEIIDATVADFNSQFNKRRSSFTLYGAEKYKNLVLLTSIAVKAIEPEAIKKWKRSKSAVAVLHQLYPLPYEPLLAHDVNKLLVLEQLADSARQGALYSSLHAENLSREIYMENGWYASSPDSKAIDVALNHLLDKESKSPFFWLDVPLIRNRSLFPKHEVLLQQIKRNYPHLERLEVLSNPTKFTSQTKSHSVSHVLSRYANQGAPFAVISRFYDDTFCLYEQAKDELIADPFQAYPIIPHSSSAFLDFGTERTHFPVFLSKHCDEIDEVLNSCAQGALPSTLITIEALINAGVKAARAKGHIISQSVSLHKKWIAKAGQLALKELNNLSNVSALIGPSFQTVLDDSKFEQEKLNQAKQEFKFIQEQIGELQIVIHPEHFVLNERRTKGIGELFILAVNPLACNGCGNCALVGDEACFKMVKDPDMNLIQRQFEQFSSLPPTAQDTIDRLTSDASFDAFAALLLNKEYYQSYLSSTSEDQINQLLRRIISFVENDRRPLNKKLAENLSDFISQISVSVQEGLSNTLPMNRMNELIDILASKEETHIHLDSIIADWRQYGSFSTIEKGKIEQKVNVINELKQFIQLLHKGIIGIGRPSAIVVIDKDLDHLAQYPFNSFSLPAVYAEQGNSASFTAGIVQGQIRHHLDEIRLIRRAELESKGDYLPVKHDKELAALHWNILTDQEKELAPPVLLVIPKAAFGLQSTESWTQLLATDYPIKVFVMDNAHLCEEQLIAQLQWNANMLWPHIAQGTAYVGRCSFADKAHLYETFSASFSYPHAAIIEVLAPDPSVFAVHPTHWMQPRKLAISTRAFIPFNYHPLNEKNTVASGIHLPTDLSYEAIERVKLKILEGNEEHELEYSMTWADWGFLHSDLEHLYTKIEYDESIVFMDQALKEGSDGKTVAIVRINADGNAQYYQVDPLIIQACKANYHNDQVFREWVSMFTEYPEKLKAVVEKELELRFNDEKAAFEQKIVKEKQEWEASYLESLKHQIKETLLDMSGM